MNITIFTEESGVKLPEIRKWKKSSGKGKDISKDEVLISLLKKNDLSLPEYDIELEMKYRNVLHEFLRPAKTMFASMFFEVLNFKNELSNYEHTSLYIISGRYGLLKEDEIIVPYISNISNVGDVKLFDKRTKFCKKMFEEAKESDLILMFLPSYFINYLLSINWFSCLNTNTTVVLVTSKNFKNNFSDMPNVKILERKGVARIGIYNREEIISIISSLNTNCDNTL
ncbi:hypothetical protein [Methanolobus bombayensis]|uniref:hypothetical protein n=1 Tax=Methanolobus bombayensis TaxID=38023 RepID=UPI001AE7A312|nr:hypothetical protein [Methanolobus bombayensis]MBP1908565.1 hypothetical protein [Methanolobus bombayensis]